MGCVKIGSANRCDRVEPSFTAEWTKEVVEKVVFPPNPNPSNFKIKKVEEDRGYLVVFINYPDCTNYEGNKILVYAGLTLKELVNQKMIDPHFSNNKKYPSPIARFEPTHDGWVLALEFVRFLQE